MPESMTARLQTPSVAASNSVVAGRNANVSLSFRSLAAVSDRDLVFGSAAAPPATFGALHGPVHFQELTDCDSSSFRSAAGGGHDVEVRCELDASNLAAMTSGEHLYACLFNVSPAISASVPALVLDLGVLP